MHTFLLAIVKCKADVDLYTQEPLHLLNDTIIIPSVLWFSSIQSTLGLSLLCWHNSKNNRLQIWQE